MQALFHRIYGVETEYGVAAFKDGRQIANPEEVARTMFRPLVQEYGATNVFLPNASRLYLDVGSHPEIATPECDNPLQLVAYDRAGDYILKEMAAQAAPLLDNARLYIFRNNVDSEGNSYGCHENYLVGRNTVLKTLGEKFLPFLITRQLICGAGKIYVPYLGSASSHFGPSFCLSQRADHVWDAVSSATTRSRPIINTRDEPHADSQKYRRLHVIVGDSNVAQPTLLLKIASTQLVLEMIEAGYDLPDYSLLEPLESIRLLSRDITGRVELPLASGGSCSALKIAHSYYEAAQAWYAQRPIHDPAFDQALDLWGRTLHAIDTGNLKPVSTEIDWVIKKTLFERYDYEITDMRLRQLDLNYHDICSFIPMLEKKGVIRRLISEEECRKAMSDAPESTRAHIRGEVLKIAQKYGVSLTADWMYLKYSNERIELADPFATSSQEAQDLIHRIIADNHEGNGSF